MKKKGLIIASLLVLVMSVVFLGCPPPEEEETKYEPVSDAAMKALRETIGYTDDLFPSPKCDYSDFKYNKNAQDEESIIIVWKGGNDEIFADYVKAWGDKVKSVNLARAGMSFKESEKLGLKDKEGTAFFATFIALIKEDSTDDNTTLAVKANDIVFLIQK